MSLLYPILLSTCFSYVSSQNATNQSTTSVVVQYRFQSPTAMPYSHANSHTSSTPRLTHSSSIQDAISFATLSAVNHHTTATPTSTTPTPVKKSTTNDNEKFFPIDFRNFLNNSTMTPDSDGRGFFLTSNGGIALIIFLVFALTFSIVTCVLLFTWRRDNPRCSRDGLKAARSSFTTLPVQHVYTNKGADRTATTSVEVVQEPVTMTTSDRKRKLGQYDGRTEERMKISQGRMKRVSFFDPTNDDVWESEI